MPPSVGRRVLAEIGRVRADAERLQRESELRRDVRGALRAIHERLAIVELEAKLSGQIDTSESLSETANRWRTGIAIFFAFRSFSMDRPRRTDTNHTNDGGMAKTG